MAERVWEEMDWDDLLDFIDGGSVVPIVGPGLQRVEYQGRERYFHQVLARRLAERLKVSGENLPFGEELHTVACRYLKNERDVGRIYTALRRSMPRSDEITLPIPLLKLAEIEPLRVFITINFDSLLTQALNQSRFEGNAGATEVLAYTLDGELDDLPEDAGLLNNATVYHLFGKLSSIPNHQEDYVVTQEDVLEWVHTLQGRKPKMLFDLVCHSNLLILGCGFAGWLARFFIRAHSRRRLRERSKIDYFVDEAAFRDAKLVEFLQKFRSPYTRFWSDGGALEFVEELHRRWTAFRPSSPAKTVEALFKEPDQEAVFISYASEDSAAAKRLGKAIRAKGVSVFLGQGSVGFGEDWGRKIRRSIQSCSLFLPVLSKATKSRRQGYYRREWKIALSRLEFFSPDQVFIMPLVVDDLEPEGVPEEFRHLHWDRLQGGVPSEAFLDQVLKHHREYQLSICTP